MIFVIGIFILWFCLTNLLHVPCYLLPSPFDVLYVFYKNFHYILPHALVTLGEVITGIFAAITLTFLCGFFQLKSRIFSRILQSLLTVMQSLPSFVLMPILLVWMGFGFLPKITVVTMTAFFPLVVSFVNALNRSPIHLQELAFLYQASPVRYFLVFQVPSALPSFFSGLHLAVVQSSMAVIASDWFGAHQGLGYLILFNYVRFQVDELFACVIALICVSVLLLKTVGFLERKIVFWI